MSVWAERLERTRISKEKHRTEPTCTWHTFSPSLPGWPPQQGALEPSTRRLRLRRRASSQATRQTRRLGAIPGFATWKSHDLGPVSWLLSASVYLLYHGGRSEHLYHAVIVGTKWPACLGKSCREFSAQSKHPARTCSYGYYTFLFLPHENVGSTEQ